jgi:hypothetical protein
MMVRKYFETTLKKTATEETTNIRHYSGIEKGQYISSLNGLQRESCGLISTDQALVSIISMLKANITESSIYIIKGD